MNKDIDKSKENPKDKKPSSFFEELRKALRGEAGLEVEAEKDGTKRKFRFRWWRR